MSHTLTFNVKDEKQNIIGADPLIDVFTGTEWGQGALNDVEVIGDKIAIEPGPGLEFDNDWVDLGNTLYLEDDHPFTAEGWMLLHSFSSRDMLLCRNDAVKSASPYTWLLGLQDGARMSAYDGSSWREVSYSFSLDTWYHLAFSFDGSMMRYYVNGEHIGSQNYSFSDSDTGRNTQIGGYSGSTGDIVGKKANIRFWDHARTQEQIIESMEKVTLEDTDGLMGHWPMNEGEGSTVYDQSGNDIHGTIQGATWGTGVYKEAGDCLLTPLDLSSYGIDEFDLFIKWKAGTAVVVESAVTDDDVNPPAEQDWEEQTNGSLITNIPEGDVTGKYLWIRITLQRVYLGIAPEFDWFLVCDDADSPYAAARMEFREETKSVNELGEVPFSDVPTSPLEFDGSNSYVNLGTPGELQLEPINPFTVEGRMKLLEFGGNDILYCKNNGRSSPYDYILGVRSNGDIVSAYDGSSWHDMSAAGAIELDTWHHYAFVMDHDTPVGERQILYLGEADGGTYGLGIEGDMKTLNHDDNAAAIESALEDVYGLGEVTVTEEEATVFDAVGFVEIGDIGSLFGDEASMAVWVKLKNGSPTVGDETGIQHLSSHTGNSLYPWTNGNAYFNTFRTARVDNFALSATVDREEWHLLTITTEPGTNGWKIYQNDELVHQVAGQSTVSLGAVSYLGRSPSTQRFNGAMKNFRLYNKVLSPEEIGQLVNNEDVSDGLVLHYPLTETYEDGEDEYTADATANSNDGEITDLWAGGFFWIDFAVDVKISYLQADFTNLTNAVDPVSDVFRVYDPDTFMEIFLDGVSLGTTPWKFTKDDSYNAKIGGHSTGNDPKGFVEEVRVWDHARTQQEIANNKDAWLTGTESGLLGLWPCDEGHGDDVYDSTANANNGTFAGNLKWFGYPYIIYLLPLYTPYSYYPFYQEGTVEEVYQTDTRELTITIAQARLTNIGLQVDVFEGPVIARITNIGLQVELGEYYVTAKPIRTRPQPAKARVLPVSPASRRLGQPVTRI